MRPLVVLALRCLLTRQWDMIVAGGPKGTVTAEALARVTGLGFDEMDVSVAGLHLDLDKFLQGVGRHRKERAGGSWVEDLDFGRSFGTPLLVASA